MKSTRAVLLVAILGLIAWEVIAALNPNIWTISRYAWSVGVDLGLPGAPVVFLLGYLLGHLTWPRGLIKHE